MSSNDNYGTNDDKKKDAHKGDHHAVVNDDGFVYNDEGLTSEQAAALLLKFGRNELPEKVIPKWYVFLSLLWQPMPVMIWIAAIIEAAIQNYIDMGILLFIQFANASISFYEINKAGDAVSALKASLRPETTVKRDGKFINIDARLVVPGDMVLLASGFAVPADCRINKSEHGTIDVDQAALTGESLPVKMGPGCKCLMGSSVVRGEMEATVEFTGADTFFGKTASLLGDEGEVSNLQQILIDIMIVLVLLSLTLCSIVFVYLLQKTSAIQSLSFTVVLIVASIPLAIEIVTNATLALGSSELSDRGAIVTRLSAVEDMAGMSILCSDKTGTLTLNKMEIQETISPYRTGETQYSILRYAAMAAKWNEPPKDAIDTLVLKSADLNSLEQYELLDHMAFDPTVKRTESTIRDNKTGATFQVSKGAAHILLKLIKDPAVAEHVDKDVLAFSERGIRTLAVATNERGHWEMLGLLTFLDPPRPDTKQTILDARMYGVCVKMITGDHLLIAKEMARRLDLGDEIYTSDGLPMLDPVTKQKPANLGKNFGKTFLEADGFAQVFPEHKFLIVEGLRELGYKVGMTGDGVNDAPALKKADVGIAVQGSTEVARAAADIVLTEPGLSTIVHGILISRCIFIRIRNFITYRIAATLQLLLFFFIAVFAFSPIDYQPAENPDPESWPTYFHMPVLLLMLITVLNDGTLISIAYDNVCPSKNPEQWNLRVLFFVGGVLGGVACLSSLLLLWIFLDSWSSTGLFGVMGLAGLSYGQITIGIYLSVSVTAFLTLFTARTGDEFFWAASPPSTILLIAGFTALTISTILACLWPASYLDDVYVLGLELREPYILPLFIWGHCVFWFLVQDVCKVMAYKLMKSFNLFSINDNKALLVLNKNSEEAPLLQNMA